MYHDQFLSDKVAVITGGGTGLGLETAKILAGQGASIAIISRDPAHLEEGRRQLNKFTDRVISTDCDIRDYHQVKTARNKIINKYGKVDILINNAAGNFLYPAEKLPHRGWKAVIDIVLNGSFYCSQIFGQEMIRQGTGQIINILATYAWTGGPGTVHSACAKAGVLALTRTLAVEWARFGIRVNAVAPGPFDTEGARNRLWPTREMRERIEQEIPLQRFARLEEVAGVLLFLLSPYAEYINGECLTVDGGAWLGKGIGRAVEVLNRFEEIKTGGDKTE